MSCDNPVEKKATRDAYGETLLELGRKHSEIVVLDADLSASTKTALFASEFPDRFFNVGVAEQNMVGMAAGFALSGLIPFVSSFAMFLSGRAWEIVRNSVAYPGLNVKLVATHAGITVGEDGASHQCIEDISLMRTIPEMKVVVPSDYAETQQIIRFMHNEKGPCYIRCGRPAVPLIPRRADYNFKLGKGELLREGGDVTIIACGIMVAESLLAAEQLSQQGIEAGVINMASIKPLDTELVIAQARQTGALVTAEEHNVIGGLGSAISEVVTENYPVPVVRLGVNDQFGQSGTIDELLELYQLNSSAVIEGVKKALALKNS